MFILGIFGVVFFSSSQCSHSAIPYMVPGYWTWRSRGAILCGNLKSSLHYPSMLVLLLIPFPLL